MKKFHQFNNLLKHNYNKSRARFVKVTDILFTALQHVPSRVVLWVILDTSESETVLFESIFGNVKVLVTTFLPAPSKIVTKIYAAKICEFSYKW